jgi:predicted nuclease with TOPRIM domain
MATIETDLKEILGEFKQEFARLNQRLDRIDSDLTTIKVSQAKMEEKLDSLDSRVKGLEDSQNKQIWTLILAITGAITAAVIKFGFFPNP